MTIVFDILTICLIVYCTITQYNWLKIYSNGARKTERVWLFSLLICLCLVMTNLARDIWDLNHFLNSFVLQRGLLFIWAATQAYFYLGCTFPKDRFKKRPPNVTN